MFLRASSVASSVCFGIYSALAVAGAARAEVTSADPLAKVYEARGDVADLTRRAMVCIPRSIQPSRVDSPTIVNSDVAAGVVVGNNVFTFDDRWGRMTIPNQQARSTLTFEAKPGRFRITHANVQQFTPYGWRAPKDMTVLGDKLTAISDTVAACIQGDSPNW